MEKQEIKARKKAYKKALRKARRPWKLLTLVGAPLAVIFSIILIIVTMFDNTVSLFVGGTFWELENEDPSAVYYEGDFATEEERVAKGAELVKQVEAEGAALLMNEENALPLAAGNKVSLFSTSSVNIVYGGTGSANVDTSKCDNLKVALEKAGLEVNQTLWDFYETGDAAIYTREDAGATAQDSAGTDADTTAFGAATIVEAPWDVYTEDVVNSVGDYGDAAIVVLSRIGGEGVDAYFSHEFDDDHNHNYLALNDTEREMMENIKALKDEGKIKRIVVLLNTSNALQVDFLKNNEYGVDAAMWIGGVGQTGLNAVAEILAGQINPSGSLVDTYYYDNYSTAAMQNFIATQYEGDLSQIPEHADTYMLYQEGIYVGYKYNETRYEDFVMGTGNAGEYAYNDEVAFPFGYGLSYTDFEYSDMKMAYDEASTTYTFDVTVTNTGDVAGKETVQIYVSSPYTKYDIKNNVEKASVSLVGFEKTDVLEPGESETVTIEVDGDYVASYDAYGAGTYILDAGDYHFTAATDSHDAVNNVLAAKGFTPKNSDGRMDKAGNKKLVTTWNNPELDTETYAVSDNGTEIKNRLNSSDPNMNEAVGQKITYLTRNDWEGTMPSLETTVKIALNDYLVKALQDQQYATDAEIDAAMPVKSVEAPGTRDENGPQGLTTALFGSHLGVETTALTSEDVLAATFNKDLVYEIGNVVGNDCLDAKITFLYGPGANTHRTPYGGRNFEYYSEDSVLSSEIGEAEVRGIEEKGVRVVMKHFALNDSEQDRIGLGAWLNEQSAREIYLRAFQGALEDSQAGGNGVMMAYTRWGTQWSGGNTNLIKGIMNEEWGCNGLQITDNVLNPMVNGIDGVMGGTTTFDSMMAFMITGNGGLAGYENDAVAVQAMREACHHNLYAIANSQAMNGIGVSTTIKEVRTIAETVVMILACGLTFFTIVFAVIWALKVKKFKKTEEYTSYKAFKAELKANK